MSDFRRLGANVWASPQIEPADITEAARLGIVMIINNRPDGEAADQPDGAAIAAAAQAAGLAYREIPVTHAGFSEAQVAAMRAALDEAQGSILAYCRSGTRSTFLWALAEASGGRDPEDIAQAAANAGYDLGPIRALLDLLAAGPQA